LFLHINRGLISSELQRVSEGKNARAHNKADTKATVNDKPLAIKGEGALVTLSTWFFMKQRAITKFSPAFFTKFLYEQFITPLFPT